MRKSSVPEDFLHYIGFGPPIKFYVIGKLTQPAEMLLNKLIKTGKTEKDRTSMPAL